MASVIRKEEFFELCCSLFITGKKSCNGNYLRESKIDPRQKSLPWAGNMLPAPCVQSNHQVPLRKCSCYFPCKFCFILDVRSLSHLKP